MVVVARQLFALVVLVSAGAWTGHAGPARATGVSGPVCARDLAFARARAIRNTMFPLPSWRKAPGRARLCGSLTLISARRGLGGGPPDLVGLAPAHGAARARKGTRTAGRPDCSRARVGHSPGGSSRTAHTSAQDTGRASRCQECVAIAVQKCAVIRRSDPSPGGAGSARRPAAHLFTLRVSFTWLHSLTKGCFILNLQGQS